MPIQPPAIMTANPAFWIPVLGIPIIALMSNIVVRLANGLPQSAVPDFILCFVVFDAVVAIQHNDFQKFIRIAMVNSSVEGFYVGFLIASLVAWFLTVTKVEHRLIACHAGGFTIAGVMWLMLSCLVATMIIFLSIAPFAYQA
jgi:hypothetical protein